MVTIDAMRWILVATTGVYIIPIFAYIFLFKKSNILWEIIIGAFSFLFYGPTYFSIINIYAMCRIDDIYLGTKLGDQSKRSKLQESWKKIKLIHVSKYVFWNIISSAILLSLASSYTSKFVAWFIIVLLIGTCLSFKIIISLFYNIKYKLSCLCVKQEQIRHNDKSQMMEIFYNYKDYIV
jgi:hypothetical protein